MSMEFLQSCMEFDFGASHATSRRQRKRALNLQRSSFIFHSLDAKFNAISSNLIIVFLIIIIITTKKLYITTQIRQLECHGCIHQFIGPW